MRLVPSDRLVGRRGEEDASTAHREPERPGRVPGDRWDIDRGRGCYEHQNSADPEQCAVSHVVIHLHLHSLTGRTSGSSPWPRNENAPARGGGLWLSRAVRMFPAVRQYEQRHHVATTAGPVGSCESQRVVGPALQRLAAGQAAQEIDPPGAGRGWRDQMFGDTM